MKASSVRSSFSVLSSPFVCDNCFYVACSSACSRKHSLVLTSRRRSRSSFPVNTTFASCSFWTLDLSHTHSLLRASTFSRARERRSFELNLKSFTLADSEHEGKTAEGCFGFSTCNGCFRRLMLFFFQLVDVNDEEFHNK